MCVLSPPAQLALVQGLWKIVVVCAVVIAGLVLVALQDDGRIAPDVSSFLLWLPLEALAVAGVASAGIDVCLLWRRGGVNRATACSRTLLFGCSICLVALVALLVIGTGQTSVRRGTIPFSLQLTPIYPLLVCVAVWTSVKCSSAQRAEGFAERFCLSGCFSCFLIALGFPAVVMIGLKLDHLLDAVPWGVAMVPLFVLDAAGLVLNCGCCALWCFREREAQRRDDVEGMPAGFAVLTVVASALLLPCAVAQIVLCVKGDSPRPAQHNLDPIYALIPLCVGWGVPCIVIVGDIISRCVRWCDRRRIESRERRRAVLSARGEQSKRNLLLDASFGEDDAEAYAGAERRGGDGGGGGGAVLSAYGRWRRGSSSSGSSASPRALSGGTLLTGDYYYGDADGVIGGGTASGSGRQSERHAHHAVVDAALRRREESSASSVVVLPPASAHPSDALAEAEEELAMVLAPRARLEEHLVVLRTTDNAVAATVALGELQTLIKANQELNSGDVKALLLDASVAARAHLGTQWSKALALLCGRALREFSFSRSVLRKITAGGRSSTEEESLLLFEHAVAP